MSLEALFCDVDDFCQTFLCQWYEQQLTHGQRKRLRASRLSVSEIMTILIHFHQSRYRHFKGYYLSLCEPPPQRGFPWAGQLSALCRIDALGFATPVCLSQSA